ncbi:MAG: nicotinamide-nucleotide amidohydrolase family protein, partial [Alphaproteobacteria bacterium]
FHKKIIERQDVAEIVTKNYIQFGRTWNPGHNQYHFFPEDFIATNNPRGLAPGLAYFESKQGKLILSGPGVPREFSEMTEIEFLPLIERFFQGRFNKNFQTVIRTKEVPEEKIFFELCPTLWQDLEKFGKVSSLPHTIGIDIVVSYNGTSIDHEKKQDDIKSLIEKSNLAAYVWQYGNESINQMILKFALENRFTFAFAESCTGGLVSSKITDLAGSSEVFMGGIVSYANSAKTQLLNVKSETLNQFGAVSTQTATEMAVGARAQFNTDFAVSISGIAGPGGGSIEKPVGTVVIGYASKTQSGARTFLFPGDRLRKKERFADMALLTLLELMQNKIVKT